MLNMIEKRNQKLYEFYNREVGDRIKRKRLEKNLTQESLANQICSNTYLSKMENNRATMRPEYVHMIMEKLGMSYEEMYMPEKIIGYLSDSVRYFFYKDVKSYTLIYDKLKLYKSNVLVYIINLGYLILINDLNEAKRYNDELKRYYNNLEDYALSIYLIYSGYYLLATKKFDLGHQLIRSIDGRIINDNYLYGLYTFLVYQIYGNLFMFSKGGEYKDIAFNIFKSKDNYRRISEMSMCTNIFNVYEGSTVDVENIDIQLELLDEHQIDLYLFILSVGDIKNQDISNKINPKSIYYLINKGIVALDAYLEKDETRYRENKSIIKSQQCMYGETYDLFHVFKNLERKDYTLVREFLEKEILPIAKKNQNIFLLLWLVKKFEKLSILSKRYKPATDFRLKIDKYICELRKR